MFIMLKDFLNHKCTISEKEIQLINWEEIINLNIIYSNIDCYYWKWKTNFISTDNADNSKKDNFNLIIEPNKNLVKRGMIVEIEDKVFWVIWKFIIEGNLKANILNNWIIDSIQLIIKNYE